MTLHVSIDEGYIHPRPRRRPSATTRSLEDWGLPEWNQGASTLDPIEAPTAEKGDGRLVAVAPIGLAVRDAVDRGRLTWSAVADQLGWTFGPGGKPDTTRVLRRLGLALVTGGRGYAPKQSLYIDRELAARIVRAAHIDPIDVGL